jgi:Helix-turn-helix domain of transposase family ISL3
VRRVRDLSCGDTRIFLEMEVRRLDCRYCGKVKRERLDFLADNPLYTRRFAYYVGRRCRSATIKDVAAELKLDWHTVKALDQQQQNLLEIPCASHILPTVSMCQANGSGRLHWALKSASVQYRAAHWQRLPISLFQFTNLVLLRLSRPLLPSLFLRDPQLRFLEQSLR